MDSKSSRSSIPPSTDAEVFKLLEEVKDPEVPVISVVELGIIRAVELTPAEPCKVSVTLTPTYSGCPALKVIEDSVRDCLLQHGFTEVLILTQQAPPWSTDWISEAGKEKLRRYGIAPPGEIVGGGSPLVGIGRSKRQPVACPFCNSQRTEERSFFGSTACKALYYCQSCSQPFEYFKPF